MIWQPEQVKAVLLVAHGTTEHMGRYEAFAAAMAAQGVAVAGFDLRGHGRNPGDSGVAAFVPGDWRASVEDVRLFHGHLGRVFPGVPRFLMGFSLGSFLVRDLMGEQPADPVAGVILMGTGYQPGWLLSVMRCIVAGQIRKVGFDKPSALVRKLSFGMYNDKFRPNRTDVDWLCAGEEALDGYLADSLVRRQTSAGLFWELLGSMHRHSNPREYERWDKNLPVLMISGGEDPVADGGRGPARIHRQMKKAGMKNVTERLLPGARHAILMDEPEKTCEIIGDWITASGI